MVLCGDAGPTLINTGIYTAVHGMSAFVTLVPGYETQVFIWNNGESVTDADNWCFTASLCPCVPNLRIYSIDVTVMNSELVNGHTYEWKVTLSAATSRYD
jgi:hypothetical protein